MVSIPEVLLYIVNYVISHLTQLVLKGLAAQYFLDEFSKYAQPKVVLIH